MEAPGHPSERNQRAKIRIPARELANLLDLPPGMRVVHVWAEHDPSAISFLIESADLDPQPFDVEVPQLNGYSSGKSITGPDGERYTRWAWQR